VDVDLPVLDPNDRPQLSASSKLWHHTKDEQCKDEVWRWGDEVRQCDVGLHGGCKRHSEAGVGVMQYLAWILNYQHVSCIRKTLFLFSTEVPRYIFVM